MMTKKPRSVVVSRDLFDERTKWIVAEFHRAFKEIKIEVGSTKKRVSHLEVWKNWLAGVAAILVPTCIFVFIACWNHLTGGTK
jgi:hypothetical protein